MSLSPMSSIGRVGLVAVAAVFAGCVAVPTGPSTMALPGTSKGFDQFQYDDGACRQYAHEASPTYDL